MKRNSKISRPKPRVTLRDLAHDLDVSIATVSRAFQDGVTIADETRQIVLTRAAELGYRPNPLARSLITKRTHIAGIVAADITNPFYPEIIEAIEQTAKLFNWDHLYLGGGNTKKINFKPGKNIEIVSNEAGLLGGVALWRDWK